MPDTQPEPAEPKPKCCRHLPTPGGVLAGLFLLEGVLWFSERWCWFPFNRYPGWTVLIAIGVTATVLAAMLFWFAASLLFRWRFQFSIRFLLATVLLVALLCSWLAVEMKAANEQKAVVQVMQDQGIEPVYDYELESDFADFGPPGPAWLHDLLGTDFFARVVSANAYTGDGLDCLTKLPHLKRLDITDILTLTKSKVLDQRNLGVTDATLKFIGKLTWLEGLSVMSDDITDDGLAGLESMTAIRVLCINSDEITDAGLEHLKGLRALRYLKLVCPAVRGRGLKHIAELTQLEGLQYCCDASRINDADLASLKGLCHLKTLILQGTKITDAGLEHLKSMRGLQTLDVSHTGVTERGKQQLRNELPNCTIY
jgi:hypothetical protein